MDKRVAEMVENVVQIITGFDGGIAPVTLKIGYADEKGCCHDGLVITECPPIVTKYLVQSGYYLSVASDGVHVIHQKTYE